LLFFVSVFSRAENSRSLRFQFQSAFVAAVESFFDGEACRASFFSLFFFRAVFPLLFSRGQVRVDLSRGGERRREYDNKEILSRRVVSGGFVVFQQNE